ncbi:boophilin-H2 [Colossoma macropomum]|uniref:boophilin-H2 n=1 Tax=Colossoma macropomum TaxID=42526 RepID=UPI001863A7FF|nr:boophilin-H2 [Colossoma macropomum]
MQRGEKSSTTQGYKMNSQPTFCVLLMAVVCALAVAEVPKCSMAPERETGEDRTVKFYYDQQLGFCAPFFNKGNCSGGNCFSSDRDCMASCSAEYQDLYPEGDAVCTLKMDPGNCYANIAMYHYDSEEKTCRMFIYKGCHGNGNRFASREECQQMCLAKSGRSVLAGDAPNPDLQTVDVGLIVGILGGIIFAVAAISAIVLFVKQRKAKRHEMKKVSTNDVEMS